MKFISYIIFIFLFAISCSSGTKSSSEIWKDTTNVKLLKSNTTLKLPKHYKRSSRFKIKDDIPGLKNDPEGLAFYQNYLFGLESDDADIDLFVDTSNFNHIITISDTEHFGISKATGGAIKSIMRENFESMALDDPDFLYEEKETIMNSSGGLTIAKFKYKIGSRSEPSDSDYFITYLISSKSQSYLVGEIAFTEEDSSDYLWSLRD